MKLLIGSYDQNIYEVEIDEKEQKFSNKELLVNVKKPSYITSYNDDIAYISMEDDIQYLTIAKEKVSLGSDTSCHVSYDKMNDLFYTSHYHSGILNVIGKKNNKFEVLDTYKYTDKSKIHFAKYIPLLDLTGVCDLGDDKLHLYAVINNKLVLKTSYEFPKGSGPRHFINHHSLPIIYVVSEYSAKVYVLKYQNGSLSLLHKVYLAKGDGAAIRINKDSTFLYASDRMDNSISSYEILDDGFLIPLQVMSTYGKHPRDFNISCDEKWVVVANMHSNNLTLYSKDLQSGSLILVDKDFSLPAGATVLFRK